MPHTLKIDFVSDISCPWCAIALFSLQQALQRLQPEVETTLRFQPFELNPGMAAGGQDIGEHLTQKYGSTPEQQAGMRAQLRERGQAVGFEFNAEGRGRIYNTFNAHRLLYWAGEQGAGQQLALKNALMSACHRDRQAMDDAEVLTAAAVAAGLDGDMARTVLQSDAYADEVRFGESFYANAGIHSVPAVIVNDRHLISGSQAPEVFEQALREIAESAG